MIEDITHIKLSPNASGSLEKAMELCVYVNTGDFSI